METRVLPDLDRFGDSFDELNLRYIQTVSNIHIWKIRFRSAVQETGASGFVVN